MTENKVVVAMIVEDSKSMLKEVLRDLGGSSRDLKVQANIISELANNLRTAAYFAELDE